MIYNTTLVSLFVSILDKTPSQGVAPVCKGGFSYCKQKHTRSLTKIHRKTDQALLMQSLPLKSSKQCMDAFLTASPSSKILPIFDYHAIIQGYQKLQARMHKPSHQSIEVQVIPDGRRRDPSRDHLLNLGLLHLILMDVDGVSVLEPSQGERYFCTSSITTDSTPRPKFVLSFYRFSPPERDMRRQIYSIATMLSQIINWNSFLMNPSSSLCFCSSCSTKRKYRAITWQKSSVKAKKSAISGRILYLPLSCANFSLQSNTRKQTAQAASLQVLNSFSRRNFSILRKAKLIESKLAQTQNICLFSSRCFPLVSPDARLSIASKQGSNLWTGWYPSEKYWQLICIFLSRSAVPLKPLLYELPVSRKTTRMLFRAPAWQMELTFSLVMTIYSAHWSLGESPAVVISPDVKKEAYAKLQGVQVVTKDRMRSTWALRQLSKATFRIMITSPSEMREMRWSVLDNFRSSPRVLSICGIRAAAGPTGERLTVSLMAAQGRMQNIYFNIQSRPIQTTRAPNILGRSDIIRLDGQSGKVFRDQLSFTSTIFPLDYSSCQHLMEWPQVCFPEGVSLSIIWQSFMRSFMQFLSSLSEGRSFSPPRHLYSNPLSPCGMAISSRFLFLTFSSSSLCSCAVVQE